MQLKFNTSLADEYSSSSQKIRVLSEDWVGNFIFCPNCGNHIKNYPNNQPVADYFCPKCSEEYELKSKKQAIGSKIVDGAYKTMLERLQSTNNPNFFLLTYDLASFDILNFLVIPKHFFIPEIIEKRKPLAATARRAGWVGCNILLQQIPQSGKIFFVRNKISEPKETVLKEWRKTLFLREEKEISTKGWLIDVMRCVERLNKQQFTLKDIYSFENELQKLHPDNKHVKDKIRQQLQVLRDKNYLEFTGHGTYRLT